MSANCAVCKGTANRSAVCYVNAVPFFEYVCFSCGLVQLGERAEFGNGARDSEQTRKESEAIEAKENGKRLQASEREVIEKQIQALQAKIDKLRNGNADKSESKPKPRNLTKAEAQNHLLGKRAAIAEYRARIGGNRVLGDAESLARLILIGSGAIERP